MTSYFLCRYSRYECRYSRYGCSEQNRFPPSTSPARGLSGWPRARRAATRRRGRHRRRHDPCTPGAGPQLRLRTVDLSQSGELPEMIEQITGEPAADAVGFEARGHGPDAAEAPATVLNDIMAVARAGASRWASPACTSPETREGSTKTPDRPDRRPPRSGLGQVAFIHHRPVPSQTVQPPPVEPDSERQGRRSRRRSMPQRSPWTRLPRGTGFRRRSRQEIRSRPAREHFRLASHTPDQKEYT